MSGNEYVSILQSISLKVRLIAAQRPETRDQRQTRLVGKKGKLDGISAAAAITIWAISPPGQVQ